MSTSFLSLRNLILQSVTDVEGVSHMVTLTTNFLESCYLAMLVKWAQTWDDCGIGGLYVVLMRDDLKALQQLFLY